METRSYPERLWLAYLLTAPAVREAIATVAPAEGSVGLDAGCGTGYRTALLAEAVGPHGRVVGVDISPDQIAVAREMLERRPPDSPGATSPVRTAAPIEFVEGDMRDLPFEDGSFDWVFCADTLWSGPTEGSPAVTVGEFRRVARAGGIVALLYWSTQILLPGYPGLECRLDEAFAATTPYLAGVAGDAHFLRAPGWLQAAGLEDITARSFIVDIQAPLRPGLREAVAFTFSMFWGDLKDHVSETDWKDYQRLCLPDSPGCILDRSDYYGYVVYTAYWGIKPRARGEVRPLPPRNGSLR